MRVRANMAVGLVVGIGVLEMFGSGCGGGSGSGGGGASAATGTSSTGSGTGTSATGAGGGAACQSAAQCPAASSTCATPACTNGACGFTNQPKGTACNDSGGHVCDGNGHCVPECMQASDCPPTGTACATPVCEPGGTCGTSNAALGTPCSDNGGVTCDGNGVCTQAHCSDGMKDGDESDVDCGGSCSACAVGKACGMTSDCGPEQFCESSICEYPTTCNDLHMRDPAAPSGVYTVDVDKFAFSQPPFQAYCDMANDGGGWTFLYKLNSGTTENPYDLWMNDVVVDDPSCHVNTKGTIDCASDMLNSFHWGDSGYTRLRVNLYKDGTGLVKQIMFKGFGSASKTDWFTASNIVTSSWADLNATTATNYFSIQGDGGNAGLRRNWFINHDYTGCNGDRGWLLVSAANPSKACAYESGTGVNNVILYADADASSVTHCQGTSVGCYYWDDMPQTGYIKQADVLTVYFR